MEALHLGRQIEQSGKRLIGVTDGFDSDTPPAKLLLGIYGLLHEWFVDQLRSQVNWGMRDAFDRVDNIQPPSVGYQLVIATDSNGEVIIR